MTASGRYDLVIVGMGSGGMVSAEFAATLGLRVAVIERARIGGDCLWTGCVPSKALLASAKAAHTMRTAHKYGLPDVEPEINTELVWTRMRQVQQQIAASDDNPDRFTAMGVDVIHGNASLTGPHSVHVSVAGAEADQELDLTTRFILICTGSRPVEPTLPGLREAGYLTSENLFELDRAPESVVMIGGGPIAIEMAQALRRLGVGTTVVQRAAQILPRDEPDLVAVLAGRLASEGVDVQLEVEPTAVTVDAGRKTVRGTQGGRSRSWSAQDLFVAVGRRPNIEGLGLEGVGIALGAHGIKVDDRMRTSVASVYAAGDVAGRHLFTHAAGYEAVRAVRDMFFPGRGNANAFIPWCTFTDPELAHAGLTVAEARERHGHRAVEVWRQELTHSDRARADGGSEGAIIVVTAKKKVVGAHILAPAAGEMIHELALAVRHEMRLTDVARLVHIYPTLATGIGQAAADAAYAGARKLRWLVRRQRG